MTLAGFPHSDILGSKPVCGSPRLFAACHVLHRRSAPRHPPFTLSSLAIKYLKRESLRFIRYCVLDSVFKDRAPAGGFPFRPARAEDQFLVELIGLEPTTYGFQSRRSPTWAPPP